MNSQALSSIICFAVLIIVHASGLNPHFCIDGSGFYTKNSTYQQNLETLLSSLPSKVDKYGFYSSAAGESPDRANAIILCRGDVQLGACRDCISNSSQELRQSCPQNIEAIRWSDECMIRYSSSSLSGTISDFPNSKAWNYYNATNPARFNRDVRTLLDKLVITAASGGPIRKFATGNATSTDSNRIYALQQCTPDLSEQQCSDCLNSAINDVPHCCAGKLGGRVTLPSCNIRFEIYPFYNQAAVVPLPSMIPPPTGHKYDDNRKSKLIIRVVIPIVVIVAVVITVATIRILLSKRKQRRSIEDNSDGKVDRYRFLEDVDKLSTVESLQYEFETIRDATNNFAFTNKLGQGGFGAVYKGKLLNGQEIAVKRLSKNSRQGDLEFKNEVMLVAKLQHRNLVRLLGFSLDGSERVLVYEFVPNSSLDHFIFDPTKRQYMDWEKRHKIIIGVTRGLQYLHEDSRLRIIHRDLKASNILLDAKMNPKISDFGMARIFELDETQGNTNRIVGTYGYMAPEYAMHGQFSVKSDVFSFGVLILEIVSGQKNSCFRNGENIEDLLSYAWKSWRDGEATNVIDPTLRVDLNTTREILRSIHIGLLCVQENVANRPTMASVVVMFNSSSLTIPLPTEPAFFLHKIIDEDVSLVGSTQSNTKINDTSSINEVSITELYPR